MGAGTWLQTQSHVLELYKAMKSLIFLFKNYHIPRALHDEFECSLALTHIVPIYTIKLNMANKYKIYIVYNLFFKMNKLF